MSETHTQSLVGSLRCTLTSFHYDLQVYLLNADEEIERLARRVANAGRLDEMKA